MRVTRKQYRTMAQYFIFAPKKVYRLPKNLLILSVNEFPIQRGENIKTHYTIVRIT